MINCVYRVSGLLAGIAQKAEETLEKGPGGEEPKGHPEKQSLLTKMYESQPEWLWLVLLVAVIVCAIGLLVAVVVLKKKNRLMKLRSITDPVTKIFNAHGFTRTAQKHRLSSKPEIKLYIISLDVAGMRFYNDSFGYLAGTRLLVDIAVALGKAFPEGIVGRFGGDRYFVMTPAADDGDLIEKINEAVRQVRLKSLNPRIVLNAGVARDPGIATDLDYIMECANSARREIAGDMAFPIRFYNEEDAARKRSDNQLISNIDGALEREEFLCYLQPKYDTVTERLASAEALVRWDKPGEGLISPGRFVPLMEKNGMIGKLDWYMFRKVCSRMGERLEEGKPVVPVSINFSRVDFAEGTEHFVSHIVSIMDEYSLPHELVEIEILESTIAASRQQALEIVNALQKQGILVAMDDFGSGYSSLAMLKDVPVSILKLDRAFLSDNCESERGRNLLACIQYYASSMGMSTVAEGVETLTQLSFLKDIGCSYIQGFLFNRPVPEAEFYRKLEQEIDEKGPNPKVYHAEAKNGQNYLLNFLDVQDVASALAGSFNRIARFDRDRDYYEILRDNAPQDCFMPRTGTMREYYEADQARIHPDDRINQRKMLKNARDNYNEFNIRNRCCCIVRRLNAENVYVWYEFELLPLYKENNNGNHIYIGVERVLNESEIPETE